ncbi:kinase-like protein [Auricularia subglabra TFB-10046 SS5]|nr:kinase-like protein [Auricularia subglabra TFB-10046 SS5]
MTQIGFGATATVFRGAIVGEGRSRLLAVKVFREPQDEHHHELIEHEVQVIRQVSRSRHLCILRVIGSGYLGRCPVIVSYYMEKGDLRKYIKEVAGGYLNIFFELLAQILFGLYYLHEAEGLVHGDIKPVSTLCPRAKHPFVLIHQKDNVLISNTGNAVIADLGLCTTVNRAQSSSSDVSEAFTVRYAAPEILLGPEDPSALTPVKTPASDMYAFGLIAYEVLTLHQPWDGFSDSKVIMEVHAGRRPSPPSGSDDDRFYADTLWSGICPSCWAFNPEDRPTAFCILQVPAFRWSDSIQLNNGDRLSIIGGDS